MNETTGKFLKGRLPKLSRPALIVGAGMLGIVLIALGQLLPAKTGKTATAQTPDAAAYGEALEQKLTALLSKTQGVGKTEVMITLAGGYRYSYATAESVDSDILRNEKTDAEIKTQEKVVSETNYIMVDGADGKQPLVLHVEDPEIQGVVVLCAGGGDPAVAVRVTETVRVALGISSGRIAVMKLDGS